MPTGGNTFVSVDQEFTNTKHLIPHINALMKHLSPTPLALIAAMMLLISDIQANNLQVTSASLGTDNGTQVLVNFDMSWENSWRIAPDRWDAAWVFIKYRTSDGLWHHASLQNTGHTAPLGAIIESGVVDPYTPFDINANPAVGAFVYRSVTGNGTFAVSGAELLWNYTADGVALLDVQEIRVFGIEMVYVAQGQFAAGSGGTESGAFTLTTINTDNYQTIPSGTGSLGGQAGGRPTGEPNMNSNWPNGFKAFYCMKYEISQQGYVDFLNTLTYVQQDNRTEFSPDAVVGSGAMSSTNFGRSGIEIQTPGLFPDAPAVYACNLDDDLIFGEANDGSDLACNYFNGFDLTAYADWTGLRPMTSMEYEKACRGTILPVSNEFAWGTTAIATLPYSISNPGLNIEQITANYNLVAGNCIWQDTEGTIDGPLRVGIFSSNTSNNGRITSGATYYGIMEMSGNVSEVCVLLTSFSGASTFQGINGNGELDVNGTANGATWPTLNGAYTSRGGTWQNTTSALESLRVSRRVGSLGGTRSSTRGGRCVRFAP